MPHTASGRHPLLAPLERLRDGARRLLVIEATTVIAAIALAALLAAGLLDFALRLPGPIRLALLLGGLALLAVALLRRLRPAVGFRPSLTDVALRVERAHPDLRDLLASAVDFSGPDDAHGRGGGSRAFADVVVRRAVERVASVRPGALLHPERARRGGAALGGIALVILVAAVAAPSLVATGAQRLLLPLGDAEWPKRTGIADATQVDVHPIGSALPFRALLTRAPGEPDAQDVMIRYRLVTSGSRGPERRELLTYQGREATEATLDGERTGALFERLLEPVAGAIEYRFTTADDETAQRTIRLVQRPEVRSAVAAIEPPAYAEALGGTDRAVDLGPGTDERAVVAPALVGSSVRLELNLNKPARIAEASRRALEEAGVVFESAPEELADTHVGRFTLGEVARLTVDLVDQHGISASDTAVFRFTGAPDRPAAATVTRPAADRNVLATALLDVTAEGRDDVALASVQLERTILVPAGGAGSEPSGRGGALEPRGAAEIVSEVDPAGERQAAATYALDLATLDVAPGDEIELVAIAADVLAAAGGSDPTRSGVRRVRVISESEFVEEIRGQLGDIRRSAIRIEEQQAEAQQRAAEEGASRAARRSQAQVGERVARQLEQAGDLESRVATNRLDDDTLRGLLRDVQAGLERAGEASARAAEDLDAAAAREDAGGEPMDEQEAERTERAQEEVREELARVVALLDRGEDAWVVRNQVQQILREQRAIQARTGAAGENTAGRRPEELTPEERRELEEIAAEQQELAERTEQTVQEMRDRARELRQSDPTTAAGLQEAARTAEEQQAAAAMQDAAQQAQQNRSNEAQERQEQAIDALEQVLEDLDAGERAREQVLRRLLASVIESLEGLVEQQRAELAALAAAEAAGADLGPLDAGMIRVNQNTLGVIDVIKGSGGELAPVLSLVSRASTAQVDAVAALRAAAPDAEAIRGHETRSLELLEQALERASAIDEELERREQEQKLRELRAAYEEVLVEERAIREETAPIADQDDVDRRARAALRRLAARQETQVAALGDVRAKTEELADARVFSFAHDRAETLAERIAGDLSDAAPGAALAGIDRLIQQLEAILEALDDPEREDEPFDDPAGGDQGGGGSGGGGGGDDEPLIPPLKELRLLRFVQMELAARTTEADELPADQARAALESLVGEQRGLSEVAVDLIQRMGGAANVENLFPDREPADGAPDPDPDGGDAEEDADVQ